MFQGFLTALLSLIPFLKEVILGNQTLRQAIMNNKFVVALGLVFLVLFGSMLYMRDAAKAANDHAVALQAQLSAKVCPAAPPITVAPSTPTVDPRLAEKDATIGQLKARVQELESQQADPPVSPKRPPHHSHSSSSNDALDRLYQHTGRP